MRTVFYTHCTDDWYEPSGCYKLEQSLKRFHADIPFVRFGSKEIEEQKRQEPRLHWDIMIPIWGKILSKDFDLVVHFDADSIVTCSLEELLAGDYDIAGVRNNDDFGDLRMSCQNISPNDYLNCGLVGSTRPEFWEEWHAANLATAHQYSLAENDVFNQLFYGGRYKTKVLDRPDANCYYGITANPSRWQEIELNNDMIFLHGKQVKVLHRAGGHFLPKLPLIGQFRQDVIGWLFRVTDSPYVTDAIGRLRGLGHPRLIKAYFDATSYLPFVIQAINKMEIVRRKIRPCDVILDLGGHAGLFSVVVSPIAKRVIACEPYPEYHNIFKDTMSHLGITNVELCRKAAWITSEQASLLLCNTNSTMHSLVRTGVAASESVIVETITIDDLMDSYNIEDVDLLKVDIEGGELTLLLDDSFTRTAARIKSIWVECHAISPICMSCDDVQRKISDRLTSLGYSVESGEGELYASR